MRDDLESDYLQRETHHVHLLDRETVLSRLKTTEPQVLLEVLQQRRIIALQFTPFCDSIMCALEDEAARDVVADLVRLEYAEENHRDLFVQELVKVRETIGAPSSRRDVVTHAVSAATQETVAEIQKLAADAVAAPDDLARLVALRFFGEVTPGHEFKNLAFALDHLGILKRGDSVFLYPHVEFDELGKLAADGQTVVTHAGLYLNGIVDRLGSDEASTIVDEWLARSIGVRRRFYGQFDAAPQAASG